MNTAARAEDVETLDGILRAFYEVISGPAGAPRQWKRDRTLYIPGVRFVSIKVVKGEENPEVEILDHEQYSTKRAPVFEKGFFEEEIHRVVRRYGNIAHVFSTYEMKDYPDGLVTGRGLNSLELYFDGRRWWIAAAVWQKETSEYPLPKEFLP